MKPLAADLTELAGKGPLPLMRPRGTALELERRRRRAVRLLESGYTLTAVARKVGAAVSAVWQWRETWRRQGPQGLTARPAPGRPPKPTPPQRRRLPALLAAGPRAYGYPNDRWTTRRLAAVIEREFGIAYHPAHLSRILAAHGWRYQKHAGTAAPGSRTARHRWAARKKPPGI